MVRKQENYIYPTVIRIADRWHILQKSGPLTTEIAIINLERMAD